MKRILVLKKCSISNLNIFKLTGGTGNSLDDETNTVPPTNSNYCDPTQNQNTCVYTDCHDTCSIDPMRCMMDPPTHP